MGQLTDFEALAEDAGFLLARLSGIVVRKTNEHLVPHELRVRQFAMLALLCANEGIPQRRLAEQLGLDSSQVVALVDELEAAGLAERTVDAADRRLRQVTATQQGRMTQQRAQAAITAAREEALRMLAPSEQQTLLTLLRKAMTERPT
ncbi:MarR family winged helix-turn-helix transcriptional regulator [Nocardia sp. NBC_01329]|uniref:MarR family winged helix-turn-helix transcriptional regulator n=1 Tax=Nocardia sp. NBC_01329 TaxID=2903594 RepID=UPI002E1292EC|nr:MarR family transcriptional regulator [Nocardia sp. NBC_01329]